MPVLLDLEADLGRTGLTNAGFALYNGGSVVTARTEVGVAERGSTGVYFKNAVSVDESVTGVQWDDDATTPTVEAAESLGEMIRLAELWQLQGLDSANAMTVTPTTRAAGAVSQVISGDGETTTTVTRS